MNSRQMTRCALQALWLTAMLVSTLPTLAADPDPPALTEEQQSAALRLAESTGQEIFVHDRASALVSDAVMALPRARKDKRLAGWISERQDDNIVVTFYGSESGQPAAAFYRGTVNASGKQVGDVQVLDPSAALSDAERPAAAARATALGSGVAACSKQYNTVVLPLGEGTERHWVVYLLPGTTRQNVVPLGGTYRIETSADGQALIAQRGFTRSCVALDTGGKQGGKFAALMITHLLDPIPTEAHVYWSLWAHLPMFVMTSNDKLWAIEGGSIRAVDLDKKD